MATRGVLLRLLLLQTLCHLTLSLGYPSPCDDPVLPNDDLGSGRGPGSGRRQTVAFLLTGGIPSSQPTLLGFHRTVTNVNARIQQEYGSFIAEIPGLYFFTFTAVSDSKSHFRIALRRNKQTVVTAFAERLGYQSASQTALVELSTDDIVYLQVEEGCIFESSTPDQTYTSFSGFLVAPSTNSWGESEEPLSPPGAIKSTPPYFTGAVDGVRPLGGFRWPSAGTAFPPGLNRPEMVLGGGGQYIRPPRVPRPPVVPGGGGQDFLPPRVPRPQVVPGVGGHGILSPGVPLSEVEVEDAISAGPSEPPLTDSRPPPAVRHLIPRPPHTDVSDLAERTPKQPMRFPADADVSGSAQCCDG